VAAPAADAGILATPVENVAAPSGEGKPSSPAESDIDIKLPDGIKADEATLAEFKAIAKKAGLDSAKASELAGFYSNLQAKQAQVAVEQWKQRNTEWVDALKSDPEFGRDKYSETANLARIGVQKLGGKELVDAIVSMGLGNHPVLVKAFARAARAMGEDSSAATAMGQSGFTDEAAALRQRYPSMFNEDGSPKA
jgi:hypothetical protein